MISARSLVNKGLIKRIGSGYSVSVWNDPWIPDSRPRSAICKGINYFPYLRVSELIDSRTSTWNLPLLNQFFPSSEVAIIMGITTTSSFRQDSLGWAFTKTGRYTVKSGYDAAQDYPDIYAPVILGPHIRKLQAFIWKINCPPKIKHFFWQIISGCVPVGERLCKRGIQIDPLCSRCGIAEETINHALFECPPALQIWALSPIPTPPLRFPVEALFTNMAHLFWHLPKDDRMRIFPWILWYIWKSRNDKLFSNLDRDPFELINLAVAETNAWTLAQDRQDLGAQLRSCLRDTLCHEERCQIDGSWKTTSCRVGLGWFCQNTRTSEILLGTSNMRRGLSPLQTEIEALIWAMHCMLRYNKLSVAFETDCTDLVKMVDKPGDWPAFSILLDEVTKCRDFFSSFQIIHIPRTKNTKADKLARSARDLPHDMYFVNSVLPVWISELV